MDDNSTSERPTSNGRETDNQIDNLLIYGRYNNETIFATHIGSDHFYGADAYAPFLRDYLEGEREDSTDSADPGNTPDTDSGDGEDSKTERGCQMVPASHPGTGWLGLLTLMFASWKKNGRQKAPPSDPSIIGLNQCSAACHRDRYAHARKRAYTDAQCNMPSNDLELIAVWWSRTMDHCRAQLHDG